MQTRFTYLLKYFIAASDFILINIVFWISAKIAGQELTTNAANLYKYCLPVVNFIWLFSTLSFGLYSKGGLERMEYFFRNSLRSGIVHFFIVALILHFSGINPFSVKLFYSFYLLLVAGLLLSRFSGTFLQTLIVRKFQVRKAVAIIGNNPGGQKLANYFMAHEFSYSFKGFLSDSDPLLLNDKGEIMPAIKLQLQRAIENNINEVYVSLKPARMAIAATLVEEAERLGVRVKLVPDLDSDADIPFQVSSMGEMAVLSCRHEPAYEVENRFKKRLFDLMVSSIFLVFIFSWLYPILALLIKLDSPGPVLFQQERTGRDNVPFWCYKFRSMRVNSGSDSIQAVPGDSRITSLGKFLRKTSLDELPQFINVFQGHMSVVGPRPHMIRHTEKYSALIDKYMVRQFLKPGITGWAQVNGYRGETKETSLMERRVAHDIWYMENWTVMLDVKIIFMTIINVLHGDENAY